MSCDSSLRRRLPGHIGPGVDVLDLPVGTMTLVEYRNIFERIVNAMITGMVTQ